MAGSDYVKVVDLRDGRAVREHSDFELLISDLEVKENAAVAWIEVHPGRKDLLEVWA